MNGFVAFLTETWELYRGIPSSKDSLGGMVMDWAKVGDVVGLMRYTGGRIEQINERYTESKTARFYCEPTDIQVGDQLRKDGQTFDVLWANDVMSMGAIMQVDCEMAVT